jgi:hypothetical protein
MPVLKLASRSIRASGITEDSVLLKLNLKSTGDVLEKGAKVA